jgi:hypothetical protein
LGAFDLHSAHHVSGTLVFLAQTGPVPVRPAYQTGHEQESGSQICGAVSLEVRRHDLYWPDRGRDAEDGKEQVHGKTCDAHHRSKSEEDPQDDAAGVELSINDHQG